MEDNERLARQRLATEIKLKRADQALARKQFELSVEQFTFQKHQSTQAGFRFFLSPAGVILAGAAIGLLGTAVGKMADYATTKQQQETSIILKASDVASTLRPEDQAIQRARNLLWFSEAHYINLPKEFVEQLKTDARVAPGKSLPLPVIGGDATAIDLVSRFEGLNRKAINDEGGRSVIGYGHELTEAENSSGRVNVDGQPVDFRAGLTPEQADALLKEDMLPAYRAVDALVKVQLSSQQRSALASFVWNVGEKNFAASTLLHKLNQGDYDAVPDELARWSERQGKRFPGLAVRRAAEAELWRRR